MSPASCLSWMLSLTGTSVSCQYDSASDTSGIDAGECSHQNGSLVVGLTLPSRRRSISDLPGIMLEQRRKPVVSGDSAFQSYEGSMSPGRLPNDVQSAVCNKAIKIDRNLYNLFWNTGAWYVCTPFVFSHFD